jgi:hypothetical protein
MFKDAIDPHAITYNHGPDVRDWPVTAQLTRVNFLPTNFQVEFTKQHGADRWPDVIPPEWDGAIYYTLWPVVSVGGGWQTTPAIEFWYQEGKHGRSDGVGGPFSHAAADWWFRVWSMAKTQPKAGDQVGFFVTSAVRRETDDVSWAPVHERSNIVVVTVPPNDTGSIDTADQGGADQPHLPPTPPSEPVPEPEPPPAPEPVPDQEPPPRGTATTIAQQLGEALAANTAAVEAHTAVLRELLTKGVSLRSVTQKK